MVRFASVVVILAASAVAVAQPAPRKADQIVFVGLLPLDKPKGKGDLLALKTAQSIRTVAEAALGELSRQPVLGHTALENMLGKGYLPRWFDCRSNVKCLTGVLAQVRDGGYELAVTGDYYTSEDGVAHMRLVAFSLRDAKVAKEIRFDLTAEELNDQPKWVQSLQPLLASRLGKVRIVSAVGDVTCTIDGRPCAFEADGQTLSALPGEHTLQLSKEEYQSETITVKVETGATQEVAIELKPATDARKVAAAGAPRRAPSLTAVRTDKLIEIDGRIEEAAWQKAWIETNFTQKFPDEGKPPSERTELRVLYDDDAIYVAIRCFDSQPDAIVAQLTRRDREIESDRVVVDISSKNDRATAYSFSVNAAGVQMDGTRFNDTGASNDWDGVWYSDVSYDGQGWTAEIKIPLAALRYTGDTTSFGFQVRRHIQRRQEIVEWSFTPQSAEAEVSYYGTLEGLSGLDAQRLLQITPYDSRRITLRRKQGPLDGTELGGNLGGDFKLGLTPGLTLDATVNPDFGTVEVDQVVLNLSTVETFFPEKRPFFLEGADLFKTAITAGVIIIPSFELFYTRRIGRDPLPTNIAAEVVEPPPSGQILGAAKVTGFLTQGLSIGLLDAVTAPKYTTIVRMPGDPTEDVLVEPLTNTGVLRLKQEVGPASYVGLIGTAVNRRENVNEAAPMMDDRCPLPRFGLRPSSPVNGRCANDAYTAGADTVLKTEDGKWGGSAMVFGSMLQRGPSRRVPDGTEIKPGDPGFGVSGELGKYGGEHWLYQLHYHYLSPKLEVNDAGFLARANQQQVKGYLTLRTTKKGFGFLKTNLRIASTYEVYADSKERSTGIASLRWSGTLPNFWTFNVIGGPMLPAYNNRETRDGALLQNPFGWQGNFELATDPRKPIEVGLYGAIVSTARGYATTSGITVSTRPASFIELDLLSSFSWTYGEPRWITTIDNGDSTNTYLFQDLDSRAWDVLLRGTWTFSPTLSLQTYAQLYLDGGHYGRATSATVPGGLRPRLDTNLFVDASPPMGMNRDFRDSALNVNVFLRWEFLPGSAFWLVYTRNQINEPYDPMEDGIGRLSFRRLSGPSTDVLLAKLSYMWEPLRRRR